MTLITLVPPIADPVSLAQIKQHLRVDHIDDDVYLTELIAAATLFVESHIRQKLMRQTLRQFVSEMPTDNRIELLAWPVASIEAVSFFSANGEEQIAAIQQYELLAERSKTLLHIDPSVDRHLYQNGIEIDFVAGYAESVTDVPANIVRALLVLISHWYEFRGGVPPAYETGSLPSGVETLLAPLRRLNL